MKRILLIAGLMMLWVTAYSQIAYYKTGWKLADQEKVHVYSTNNGSVEFEIAMEVNTVFGGITLILKPIL